MFHYGKITVELRQLTMQLQGEHRAGGALREAWAPSHLHLNWNPGFSRKLALLPSTSLLVSLCPYPHP